MSPRRGIARTRIAYGSPLNDVIISLERGLLLFSALFLGAEIMTRECLSLAVAAAPVSTSLAQTDPADAKKTVQQGGKFWSSPLEYDSDEGPIAPGKRLLFWPVEDENYDATRRRLTIKFHWVLMPGEKPFKKGQSLMLRIHAPDDPAFRAMATIQPAADAEYGVVSATLPLEKCECPARAKLVLYLGLKEPHSNLLEVQARFERVARAPRPEVR